MPECHKRLWAGGEQASGKETAGVCRGSGYGDLTSRLEARTTMVERCGPVDGQSIGPMSHVSHWYQARAARNCRWMVAVRTRPAGTAVFAVNQAVLVLAKECHDARDSGGARGCWPRSNVSTIIIAAPQCGQT